MTILFYLFLAVAALLIVYLLFTLVTQLRSSRDFEKLDEETVRAKKAKANSEVKSAKQPKPAPVEVAVETAVIKETATIIETPPAHVVEEAIPESDAKAAVEVPAIASVELKTYPPFDHARAVEQLALSEEEAVMFVGELVQQVRDELPKLRTAVEARDMKNIEEISHLLKGSATNLGDGGIADALTEFNDYCKHSDDPNVLATHLRQLEAELEKLAEKYEAVGS